MDGYCLSEVHRMASASHSTKIEFPNDVTHSDACLAQKFNHLRRAGSIFWIYFFKCMMLVIFWSQNTFDYGIYFQRQSSTYKFFPLNVLNNAYLGIAGGRGQARLPIMHSSHTQSSSIYKHTHTPSHTHTRTHKDLNTQHY